jgi:hypothetical protein
VFGIEGFLPYDVHSLEKQCHRAWNQLLKVGPFVSGFRGGTLGPLEGGRMGVCR